MAAEQRLPAIEVYTESSASEGPVKVILSGPPYRPAFVELQDAGDGNGLITTHDVRAAYGDAKTARMSLEGFLIAYDLVMRARQQLGDTREWCRIHGLYEEGPGCPHCDDERQAEDSAGRLGDSGYRGIYVRPSDDEIPF